MIRNLLYRKKGEMSLPVPAETLSNWVYCWKHYDDLANVHSTQANTARKLRDDYEGRIVNTLKGTPHESMIIQTNSYRLQIVDEKHTQPLTVTRLEDLLHDYFKSRHPTGLDETTAILRFIRENKGYTMSKKLKKAGAPALPKPPVISTAAATATPTLMNKAPTGLNR